MNRELVKKYKKEFNYWLNGGKLLAINTRVKEWTDVDSGDHWAVHDTRGNVKFIINDEYVELRKALAEGRAIQHAVTSIDDWQDVNYINTDFILSSYRIKPDEPKFEAAEWVRQQKEN